MPNKQKAKWFELLFYSAIALLVLVLAVSGSMQTENEGKVSRLEQEKNNLIKELEDKKIQEVKLAEAVEKKPPAIKKVKAMPLVKHTPPAPQTFSNVSSKCEQYRPLFLRYDWNVDVAMAIAASESSCNPNAVSPTFDYGLMQLHGVRIFDPAQNIRYAYYEKYLKGGWGHWTQYNNGNYLRYL